MHHQTWDNRSRCGMTVGGLDGRAIGATSVGKNLPDLETILVGHVGSVGISWKCFDERKR